MGSALSRDELHAMNAYWRAANTYIEGTYSELYPNVSQDAEGMRRLFNQFSFPGGILGS